MPKWKWTDDEISYLREAIPNRVPKTTIIDRLGRTWSAITRMAKILGVEGRRKGGQQKANLAALLGTDPLTLYWIGFLLADGHFCKAQNLVSLKIQARDLEHLKKFGSFIGGSVKPTNVNTRYPAYIMRASNKEVFPVIAARYDTCNHKTYMPPYIRGYDVASDQMTALIIGFFDGDGTIVVHPKSGGIWGRIAVHESWLDNLLFMKDHLDRNLGRQVSTQYPKLYRRYAFWQMNHSELLRLKAEAYRLSLPILDRKWDRVRQLRSRPPLSSEQLLYIRNSDESTSKIARILDVSNAVVRLAREGKTFKECLNARF
jgi:hypothetical protein